MLHPRGWLLALWVCGMLAVMTLPWGTMHGHAEWTRVTWVPFSGSADKPSDVILNIVAFVPLGFLLRRPSERRTVGLVPVLGAAILVSAIGEFTQVFNHSRYPSATDIVSNTLGAYGGFVLGLRGRLR